MRRLFTASAAANWGIGVLLAGILVASGAPADPSGPAVLYIGDSHSTGQFGAVLDELIRREYPNTTSVASCGFTASNWLTGYATGCGYRIHKPGDNIHSTRGTYVAPSFSDFAKHIKPQVQLTVIQLGTNDELDMIMLPGGDRLVKAELTKFLTAQMKVSPGGRCFWIGPPDHVRPAVAWVPRKNAAPVTIPRTLEMAQKTRNAVLRFNALVDEVASSIGSPCRSIAKAEERGADGQATPSHDCRTPAGQPIRYADDEGDGIHYEALSAKHPAPKLMRLAEVWARCACTQMGLSRCNEPVKIDTPQPIVVETPDGAAPGAGEGGS